MIAIIKYNAGNTLSVKNAVEQLGYKCIITDNQKELINADKVILPGVGEAGSAMRYLKQKGLDELIPQLRQPVLGICLGLQLMCKSSEEGNALGLDIFNTEVKKLPPLDLIPHTGWNTMKQVVPGTTFPKSYDGDYYFVHRYYAQLCNDTTAVCEYGISFSAVLEKRNFIGAQFHPEKSSKKGSLFLKKFLSL
jgi:imidazole glycerol-phosphate synthase subunit HisH